MYVMFYGLLVMYRGMKSLFLNELFSHFNHYYFMSGRGANLGMHGWLCSCNRKKSSSFNLIFNCCHNYLFLFIIRYKLMMVLFPFIVVLMNCILFLKRLDFYSHNVIIFSKLIIQRNY